MIARHTPIALALLLALGGCAIGPDFLRPKAELPATFADTESSALPATVNAQWWTLFADPELNKLVDQALEKNADLRLAISRVKQADAAAREVGASLFPEINAQASGSNSKLSEKTATWSPSSPDILRARGAALTTSYELDVWGRVRRSNEAAEASLLANRHSRDAIRLSVSGLVAANYLSIRALDAQLTVTAQTLRTREESAKLVATRVAAGLVSPLDQHQAESAVAAARAQQAELRRQRALAENQLALLTGNPALRIAAGDLMQLPLPPVPPSGLPSELIEARPDVREAEARLIAANANIGVAKAGYFPKFSLTGSLGSESKTLGDLFGAGAGTWSFGLGALLPIFDFGKTRARVAQAEALNEQSLINWENALQTAFKEVRDALANLRENAVSEEAQQVRVSEAGKAFEVASKRYAAGYSGYLDLLDAQRSLNEAQLAQITTRQARLGAAVNLFKALGGGWQAEKP